MRNSNLGCPSANKSHTSLSFEDYNQDVQEEESGWTTYFDDFFSSKTPHQVITSQHIFDVDDDHEHSCDQEGSGSMVSDAASCAAWKSQYKISDAKSTTRAAETLAACSSFDATQMIIHKKLRFKTSNNRHKIRSGGHYDDSLEDTASSPVNSPKGKGDCNNELKQQVVEVNKNLKKKGLCLVPYSMLMNYIG